MLRRYPQQQRHTPGPTSPPVLLRVILRSKTKSDRGPTAQSGPDRCPTAESRPDRGPTAQSGPDRGPIRWCNRGPSGARAGPDGAIGARVGPDRAIGARWSRSASGPPPNPATHIIAERRFCLGCGLTSVSSKTRRYRLGS